MTPSPTTHQKTMNELLTFNAERGVSGACTRTVRTALLLFVVISVHLATGSEKDGASTPTVFPSEHALYTWLTTSTIGACRDHNFTYNGHRLVVAFRCHTSGGATAEPFIFLERAGKWVRLLKAPIQNCEMEATMENDAIVLWSLTWPDGKRTRTEALRYDLTLLK
jgi:hypothetical protein